MAETELDLGLGISIWTVKMFSYQIFVHGAFSVLGLELYRDLGGVMLSTGHSPARFYTWSCRSDQCLSSHGSGSGRESLGQHRLVGTGSQEGS